jgi:hypothetical protein
LGWDYGFSDDSLLYALAAFSKYEKYYNDPLNQRSLIRIENLKQIGVYCWFNNINKNIILVVVILYMEESAIIIRIDTF